MTKDDFHEGDLVTVKEDICSDERVDWVEGMNVHKGKTFAIRKMFDIGCTLENCHSREPDLNSRYDRGYYLFAYKWLEPYNAVNFDEDEITCLFKET